MAEIVRLFYPDVYRFCSRLVGLNDGEDAALETFVVAQGRIRHFRGDSSLKTWLLGIALNVSRNLSRKRKTLPLADWDYPSCDDPSERLIGAEALRTAVAQLAPEHRDAVILHEMEGLTYEECGKVLGIPAGTVKSRIYHAFKQLRAHLDVGETA